MIFLDLLSVQFWQTSDLTILNVTVLFSKRIFSQWEHPILCSFWLFMPFVVL